MKSNIFKLKTTSLLWGLAFYMPIVSLYFLQGGVALSAIVVSQVFYSIFSFLGGLPTGIFADKAGKKYAVVLGHLLNVLAFSIMFVFPTTAGLFVTYSLLGLGDSFLNGISESVLYENSEPGTFKKHLGQFLANETIGFAIGTIIAGLILSKYGAGSYRFIILLTICAKALATLVAVTIKKTNAKAVAKEKAEKSIVILRKSFGLIKSNDTIRTLTWVTLLTLSGEYFLYSVYQPYFQKAGVPDIFLGLVLTLGAILNFFVIRYAYLLEKKLPLEKIVVVLNCVLTLGYIIMSVFVSPVFLVLSFIGLKGFFNAQVPIINDYIHERIGDEIRATVMSGIGQIKDFVQIGARILLGVLVGVIGIRQTLLVQGLYLAVGIGLSYWLMVRCGCTHRIASHHEDQSLEAAEIQ